MRHVYSMVIAYLMQLALDAMLPASAPRMLVIAAAGAIALIWSAIDTWLTRSPQESASE